MPGIDEAQILASRKILEASAREKQKYYITIEGKQFVVLPGVFSPKYFGSTKIFSAQFPYRQGDTVLEIGCGTGITSVLAAQRGATRVLSVDISSAAVENARANAAFHGVSEIVEARLSDLFSRVRPAEKFSTIYWNTNFIGVQRDYVYRSVLERSLFDPGYQYLDRFIGDAQRYLLPSGRLLVGFGDIGDDAELRRMANSYCFQMSEIGRGEGTEGGPVNFILLELRPTNLMQGRVRVTRL
jgi:release factor glutamine methyltransferase